MKRPQATVQIPVKVLESVDTLDELEDWLTAQHAGIMRELRQARRDDLAGGFKAWKTIAPRPFSPSRLCP